MVRIFLAFILLLAPPCQYALAAGTVSSADPRASEAGMEMLRKGGSATDAAMAMMLTLTVIEPQSSGIGGGGFLVHHDATHGLTDTIDGRETAPTSAHAALFLGSNGAPEPFIQAVLGGKSVGIPGNIALMKKAHDAWGILPWADLFAPAIRHARNGFAVSEPLAARLTRLAPFWEKDFPKARALYWRDGKPAAQGTMLHNPALADFLEKLAKDGAGAFYSGDNARAIIDATGNSSQNPTRITLEDIAAYRAKTRPPVCSYYRSYKVCGMGPPSSGATTVLQILGMLERFDLRALGKDSPQSWHLISEAMQLAYADRGKYLADRDYIHVPVAGLIDPAYMSARSKLISRKRARGHYEAGTPPGAEQRTPIWEEETPGTTHFIAVDGNGNIASMTSTVEGPFGSQLIANGYFLNNELTDFSFAPEQNGAPVANRVQPGKRPLSSMSPTIVYDESGKPVFVVGAAGGKTIIMQVAKAIIAHLDWKMEARDALKLGLVYYNDAGLILESGTGLEPMQAALEKLGHQVTIKSLGLKANAAERMPDGSWHGAADPRSIGVALTE